MRILITGANGQLGQALQHILETRGDTVIPTDVPDFDITSHEIVDTLAGLRPDTIIHCAAMTNVDGCAQNPDLAFSINAYGTQNVAHACLRCNADMVAVSTNEVFAGTATEPYRETDPTNPINPYGSSKRTGEQMAARYIKDRLYIVVRAGGEQFSGQNHCRCRQAWRTARSHRRGC